MLFFKLVSGWFNDTPNLPIVGTECWKLFVSFEKIFVSEVFAHYFLIYYIYNIYIVNILLGYIYIIYIVRIAYLSYCTKNNVIIATIIKTIDNNNHNNNSFFLAFYI